MKVAIWYQYTNQPVGGSNNFLRRLGHALEKMGHTVHFGYVSGADVVLINAFVAAPNRHINLGEVAQVWATGKLNIKSRFPWASVWYSHSSHNGPFIVHRMDGVTQLYGRNTPEVDLLAAKINKFADFTIYQSEFCRESFSNFGIPTQPSVVINNGVPIDVFYPKHEKLPLGKKIRLVAVSWSSNPKKGYSTLAKLSLLPDVEITFVGNWPDQISQEKVNTLKPKSEHQIAEILREHDAFVHAAYNEPSSNAIIEALACGLPVIYRDSGGNKELVKDCGISFGEGEDLQNSIIQFRSQFELYRENTLRQLPRFSIDYVAKKYIEAIDQALGNTREQ